MCSRCDAHAETKDASEDAAAAAGASWTEAFAAASVVELDALSHALDVAIEKMSDVTTPFSLPLGATMKLCIEKKKAAGEGWTTEVAIKFGTLVKLLRDAETGLPASG